MAKKEKKKNFGGAPSSQKEEKGTIKKIKIGILGIGGGGGNIISQISQQTKIKLSFFVADTDTQTLKGFPKNVVKFQFGQALTKGLGTGMNPSLGREAAKREKEEIKKILSGYDLIILVATLGGGVGSGATPVFAQILKSLGTLTYGIFTLPFLFEGKRKRAIAREALLGLKKELNAYSLLPNERIFQVIEKETPLIKAFAAVNQFLAENIQNLAEVIFRPALINIDFSDLRTILEGEGLLVYLNSLFIESPNIEKEIEKIVHFPLYPYSLEGAKGVLLNIKGPKNLSLKQVTQISQAISAKVDPEAKIIFGISETSKKQPTRLTILASGLSSKVLEISLEKKEKKKKPPSVKEKLPVLKKKKEEKPKEEEEEKLKEEIIRKNGLQLKKEIEKEEAELLMREKFWETPTFLRRKRTA